MRISELSTASGVSVASLKYYLREGLLAPGLPQGSRSATYDGTHLARVRLIRALVDSGGLSIAAVHTVISALDRDDLGWNDLLGVAQYALASPGTAPVDADAASEVATMLAAWGWEVTAESPFRTELAVALRAMRSADVVCSPQELADYAAAMHAVAEVDLTTVPRDSPELALRQVVVGTVLVDPMLAAMRKLAQEAVSQESQQAAASQAGSVRPATRPGPPHRRAR